MERHNELIIYRGQRDEDVNKTEDVNNGKTLTIEPLSRNAALS
jgi:hypothetical protein